MEYKKTQSEIKDSTEYRSAGAEYSSAGREYFVASEEYKSVAKEIHFEGEETKQETPQKEQKSKRRMMSKKVRQMGYLVAASAAVVMVSQTVPDTNSGAYWDDKYFSDYYEDGLGGNPDFDYISPDDDGSPNADFSEGDSYIEDFEGMIPFDDGAGEFGIANAGLLPVRGYGDWRLMDYSGNTIAGGNSEFDNLYNSPTNTGYTIFENISERYWVVLNRQGEVVYRRDFAVGHYSKGTISDDNILFIYEVNQESQEYITISYEYRTLDGTVLYQEPEKGVQIDDFHGRAFMDGCAVFTVWEENNGYQTYSLASDGTLRALSNEFYADTSNVDGFYLSTGDTGAWLGINASFSGGSFYLVDSLSGEALGELDNDYFMQTVLGIEPNMYRSINFQYYFKEGRACYNYDAYVCITVYDSQTEESYDVLIDYRNVDENGKVDKKVVSYSDIIFDDYQYLCVRDGENYYYIDWSGSVISGPYKNATAFTNTGYTMVTDMDGTTKVLNSAFKAVDTMSNITKIDTHGDVFIVERGLDSLYWKYMYVPGDK